jgi:hypothetical protein
VSNRKVKVQYVSKKYIRIVSTDTNKLNEHLHHIIIHHQPSSPDETPVTENAPPPNHLKTEKMINNQHFNEYLQKSGVPTATAPPCKKLGRQ